VHIAINDPSHYPLGPEFTNVGNAIFDIAPTAENYIKLMDANGVEQAVLVQHDPVYGEDNSYIADAVRKYPKRFVAVGRLEAKADAVEKMRYWVKERGLAGFRVNGGGGVIGGTNSWIESAETMRIWETAVELKTPLLLLLGGTGKAESLAALGRAMKRVPQLQLVLDHMADYNSRSQENVQATIDPALLDAASVPNLFQGQHS
jgi:L-fuconolactonase